MILSDCCKAKTWIVCGKLKLSSEDIEGLSKVPRGRTMFYLCNRCDNACSPTCDRPVGEIVIDSDPTI